MASVTSYRHYVPTPSGSTVIIARNSDGTTATTYALTDQLGSTDALLDESGNLIAQESFGPFGQRRASDWGSGSPTLAEWAAIAHTTRRAFTFHESLDNIGLIHMNGRVYDANVGHFLSPDPIVGNIADSQSINPYAYVGNRPLSRRDPTGLIDEVVVTGSNGSGGNPFAAVLYLAVHGISKVAKKIGHLFGGGHGDSPPPPPSATAAGGSAQAGIGVGACGGAGAACGGLATDAGGIQTVVVQSSVPGSVSASQAPPGYMVVEGRMPGTSGGYIDFHETVGPIVSSPSAGISFQVTISAPKSIYVSFYMPEEGLGDVEKEVALELYGGIEKRIITTVEARIASRMARSMLRNTKNVPGRVASRINLSNKGWSHVVTEHIGVKNKSYFSMGQQQVRTLLTSKGVVRTPVSRILWDNQSQDLRFVRESMWAVQSGSTSSATLHQLPR